MNYTNNTRRFIVLALMLALVLFGNLPFNPGVSAPAAAAPPPSSVAGSPVTDEQTRARVAESFGKLPLYFVENRGQLDKRVGYYVQGSDKTIYFTNDGLTFVLNPKPEAQPEISKSDKQQSERWTLKLDFVGARAGARPEGKEQTGATFSYFKGKRSQWQAGLKSYSEIVYRELWPGIDLVYAGTVNRMKYTFVVKPGADPNRIKLAWRGASGVKLNAAGELEVTTPAGGFTDQRPVSWQETNGQQVDVATKYRIEAQRKQPSNAAIAYGFELGEYDRSRELVIDPAVLVYCGFIGGSSSDQGLGIAVDSAGNAYVTGSTNSTEASFPVTVGPDLTHNGSGDAFVAKVNAGGTALVYCGYIGGSGFGFDFGDAIAVDSAGNAYVTGSTNSTEASFPVTVGPDLTFNSGVFGRDAFVAKVNASGTALVYCGYIGGSGFDQGNGIAVDSAGNAYVTGSTESTEVSFPVTVGPDLTFNGSADAFVAKVNASGTALVYCGYIGGSDVDSGADLAVDSAGNAYVTGSTESTEASFPVTVGPDLTYNGDVTDGFVAKVNASGTALSYCGYIGGNDLDDGHGIAVDSAGNAYVTGNTISTEASFPVTGGPDLTFNSGGGDDDAFVAKVNAGGTALVYCGYIGGSDGDSGNDLAVDSAGNAYVIGLTFSSEASFPVTGGPDLTFNGVFDAFVAKVNASGTALDYCGYIGGSTSDTGVDIVVDSAGNAYVTGLTISNEASFPVTGGPDLTFNGGGVDAFVAKISAPNNCATDALYSVIAGPQGQRGEFTGTVGSKFTVGANVFVDKLGFEDQLLNGLASTHQVGLWNSSGTLLALVTVQSGTGSLLIGNWRYETLPTPVKLTAGSTYIVGARVTNGGDKWTDNGNFPIEFAINQGFSLGSPPNVFSSGGFAFPNLNGTLAALRWAPANLQFSTCPITLVIARVQDLITAGTLTQNQGAGLIDKLNQVSAKLDSGQTAAACNQLNSFINQVNAFINNGSLSQTQGQALIDAANAIKADSGCP